jgi:hypothetical protein
LTDDVNQRSVKSDAGILNAESALSQGLITRVAVLATCGTEGQPGTIKDARATIRGRIEGKVAYNERHTRLGEYRNGKTYLASGALFGYANLLPALIVNDAKRRGVWS